MSNYSVVSWNTILLFSGDPVAFVDFHESIGAEAICIKIGNGLRPWQGLEPFIAEAKRRGYRVVGWWFYYGYKSEAQISADHATKLGIDLLALDIESQWENRAGLTTRARENRAESMMRVIKARFMGSVALCSWWKPSAHRTPVGVFLNNGCDFNMPQWYPIGRRTDALVRDLIDRSLDEYARLANWPANKTIPVLASYGQSYGRGGKYFWKITVTQMQTEYDYSISRGCPKVLWWSLDYLMGGAGHEAPKGIVEVAFINKIKSFSTAPIPGPTPAERLRTVAHEINLIANILD